MSEEPRDPKDEESPSEPHGVVEAVDRPAARAVAEAERKGRPAIGDDLEDRARTDRHGIGGRLLSDPDDASDSEELLAELAL